MYHHTWSNIFLKLDNLIYVSDYYFVSQMVNQLLDGFFFSMSSLGSLGRRHINFITVTERGSTDSNA